MSIALLGYGVVGKAFEKLCLDYNLDLRYILRRNPSQLTDQRMTLDIKDILLDKEVDTVIDCMSGIHPAFEYVYESLKAKKNVITANKKMLAHNFKALIDTARNNNVKLSFSSSCGGGIPWIKELIDISSHDEVNSIFGIMNSTSNYILYKMYSENKSFEEALSKAQELGFAEADPSDDIDGIDTTNKLTISSNIAFKKVFTPEDVFRLGIRNISLKELEYARKHDSKCILLAKGISIDNKYCLSVMPTMVPLSNTLASAKENYNCFILKAKLLPDLSLIGQGAGGIPTASNLLRDYYSLENMPDLDISLEDKPTYDILKHAFYLRTNKKINEDYIKERIAEDIYLLNKMTIAELRKIIDENDFVMEVME